MGRNSSSTTFRFVVQIVDSAENIQRLLPVIEEMIDKGLIAISDVNVVRIQ